MLLSALLAASVGAGAPADWPAFRGDGSGVAPGNYPVSWSPTEGIAWKAELPGYGQSSPVVWKGRVYATAVDGLEKEKLFVAALDAATGKRLWVREFAAARPGKNNPMMSRAAATPVADANGLVCLFESGDLVALTHDGGPRWRRDLGKDHGEFKNNHGLGSSLARHGRAAFVLVDHAGPSYLLAVDTATGADLWKAPRESRGGWTSPVVTRQNGKAVVVVSGGGNVAGYDAATGAEAWKHDGLVGNTIPSPTPAGDLVLVGAGENRVRPDPAASARSNCCLRLTAAGVEPVWQAKGLVSQYASPLAHRGVAYFVTPAGVVHGLDLATGRELFAERLDNPVWAAPVAAGDHVYFFGKDGITTVLRAGAEFEKVATNRLWAPDEFARRREAAKAAAVLPEPPAGKGPAGGPPLPKAELDATRYSAVGDVVYAAAAADGAFFLRTGTELTCVRRR